MIERKTVVVVGTKIGIEKTKPLKSVKRGMQNEEKKIKIVTVIGMDVTAVELGMTVAIYTEVVTDTIIAMIEIKIESTKPLKSAKRGMPSETRESAKKKKIKRTKRKSKKNERSDAKRSVRKGEKRRRKRKRQN